MLRLRTSRRCAMIVGPMSEENGRGAPHKGRKLISLAQKLARDAERHAILSASLASQADRLMVAGLELLDGPPHRAVAARTDARPRA